MAREVGTASMGWRAGQSDCGCMIVPCYHLEAHFVSRAEMYEAFGFNLKGNALNTLDTPARPTSWLVRVPRGNITRTYGPFGSESTAVHFGEGAFGKGEFTTEGLLRPPSVEETRGTLMEFAQRVADGEDCKSTIDDLARAVKLYRAVNWG